MSDIAITEVRVRMAAEEFGEVGFTNEDRKLLITLAAHFENMKESLTRIERASKDDLARIERDLRETIAGKADRSEIPTATVAELKESVENLNRKVTWAYAFGAGGAAACSAITYLLTSYFRH